jgi:hypothetical protein
MHTYIVIDPTKCDRSPDSDTLIFTENSVLGTAIAKSPGSAKLLLAKIGLENLLCILSVDSKILDHIRGVAKAKPILVTQQVTLRKPTSSNPLGAGRICKGIHQNLTLILDQSDYDQLRLQPNMGKYVSQLVADSFKSKGVQLN